MALSVLCDVGCPGCVDQEEETVGAPQWWRLAPRSRIALFYGRHHDRDAGVPDREPELRRCVSATNFRNQVPDPVTAPGTTVGYDKAGLPLS